jgi:hypothetical protein
MNATGKFGSPAVAALSWPHYADGAEAGIIQGTATLPSRALRKVACDLREHRARRAGRRTLGTIRLRPETGRIQSNQVTHLFCSTYPPGSTPCLSCALRCAGGPQRPLIWPPAATPGQFGGGQESPIVEERGELPGAGGVSGTGCADRGEPPASRGRRREGAPRSRAPPRAGTRDPVPGSRRGQQRPGGHRDEHQRSHRRGQPAVDAQPHQARNRAGLAGRT